MWAMIPVAVDRLVEGLRSVSVEGGKVRCAMRRAIIIFTHIPSMSTHGTEAWLAPPNAHFPIC